METNGLPWTMVVLVSSVLFGEVLTTFEPGCSFVGDQCQYTVKLGHQGNCDTTPAATGSSCDGQSVACCDDLTGKYSQLTDDLETLRIKVDTISKVLQSSNQNMTSLEDELQKALQARDDVLAVLNRKEKELNSTKSELSKVMGKAADEIKNLRDTLAAKQNSLSTCQKALGLTVGSGDKTVTDGGVDSDYGLIYYNFNKIPDDFTLNKVGNTKLMLMSKGSSVTTGPRVEHSTGTRKGFYLGLNSDALAQDSRISSMKHFVAETGTFPPANAYCIMFWYFMEGKDVKTLSLNIKINDGVGYPIFESNGQNRSGQWQLGQVEIDSEYSSYPFKIDIGMSSNAYKSYHSGYYSNLNDDGDIAVDDFYIYNTTCPNIPQYPEGAYQNSIGNTTSFYTFHATPMTWMDAYDTCRRASPWSALVSIDSPAEQAYLVNTIKHDAALSTIGQNGYYTSGSDADVEHHFSWTNTGVPRSLSVNFWHQGQPNNVAGDQDCLLMEYARSNYEWGDENCNTKHPFICEVEK